jgi:hypothetical protein
VLVLPAETLKRLSEAVFASAASTIPISLYEGKPQHGGFRPRTQGKELGGPIAYFVNDVFGQNLITGRFAGTPGFFSPLALLVFLIFVARCSMLRPFAASVAAADRGATAPS